jgi:hypothetical protein
MAGLQYILSLGFYEWIPRTSSGKLFRFNLAGDLADSITGLPKDLSRRALESFALDEYKSGHLTENGLRRMLGLTRYELDGFLKAHDIWLDYTIEDLRREVATLERLGF